MDWYHFFVQGWGCLSIVIVFVLVSIVILRIIIVIIVIRVMIDIVIVVTYSCFIRSAVVLSILLGIRRGRGLGYRKGRQTTGPGLEPFKPGRQQLVTCYKHL